MKHYILGTDEAGYGPNLGPFTLACTQWEIPENAFNDRHDDLELLHELLAGVVTDTPPSRKEKSSGIVIGDSKKIYTSIKSLDVLHNTLFQMLALLGRFPKNWPELLQMLAPQDKNCVLQDYFSEQLFTTDDVDMDSAGGFAERGVTLREIQARVITPRVFNESLKRLGNKSCLLTEYTLELITAQLEDIASGQITIICDKHGGRNHYVDILYHWFPEHPIKIMTEGREASIYRFGPESRQIEFRFLAKADRMIPTGLASMTSKYLRERAMEIFNRFWTEKIPHLKPTAGYPVDAVRFYGKIKEEAAKLGIPQSSLWRER